MLMKAEQYALKLVIGMAGEVRFVGCFVIEAC